MRSSWLKSETEECDDLIVVRVQATRSLHNIQLGMQTLGGSSIQTSVLTSPHRRFPVPVRSCVFAGDLLIPARVTCPVDVTNKVAKNGICSACKHEH